MRHALALTCVMFSAGPALAETWQPVNKTAVSVTGKVQFTPTRITFQGGKSLSLKAATPEGMDGQVFKVLNPSDPVLLRGNKLCGNAPVKFLVISKGDGGERDLAVYTTAAAPFQDTGSCASYGYKAGR